MDMSYSKMQKQEQQYLHLASTQPEEDQGVCEER